MSRLAPLLAVLAPLAACISPLLPVDGGSGGDGGERCDAGPALQSCAAAYAGCTTFTDLTGGAALINFGGTLGEAYSPACLQVRVGQPVTFQGDFTMHPLRQACGPSGVISSAHTGPSATYSFCVPGTFGFYCGFHGTVSGNGMAGAIRVIP